MTTEALIATTTVPAPPTDVFAVLTDPSRHAAIDGTGWVCEPIDGEQLTEAGQVFRMTMFHPHHPDGHYTVANQVRDLDPPRAISWAPGQEDDDGELGFGGWTWRYDLVAADDDTTEVTLTYDWSGATPEARENVAFPPFGREHLDNSLRHLAELSTK